MSTGTEVPTSPGKPTGPAPGWYPDPEGQPGQRYWDGDDWTAHFVPYPPQFAEPSPSSVFQEPANTGLLIVSYALAVVMPLIGFILGIVVVTRPNKATSKHGIWIILLSIAVFIVGLVILAS